MKGCKHKNRLQIYLDGWMDLLEAGRLERHLKQCSECQAELVEIEEMASAAFGIVDHAPEREYWSSFYPRVLNRIIARDVTPYGIHKRSLRNLRLKISSYSVAIMALAAGILYIYTMVSRTSIVMHDDNRIIQESLGEQPLPAVDEVAKMDPGAQSISDYDDLSPDVVVEVVDTPVEERRPTVKADDSNPLLPILIKADQVGAVSVASIADRDFGSYFKHISVPIEAELNPDNGYDLLSYPALSLSNRVSESYRLSSKALAAGILLGSESGNKETYNADFNRLLYDVRQPGRLAISAIPLPVRWGYMSKPEDSMKDDEFERYLIELELIHAK